jgi:cell division protein FtsL
VIRVSTLIWILLVTLSGYAMFQVKEEVAALDTRLAHLDRQIASDNAQIRALDVEWATLTQPQRLEMLSARVLDLTPVSTTVLGALDEPPLRDNSAPAPGGVPIAKKPAGPRAPGAQLAEIPPRTRP